MFHNFQVAIAGMQNKKSQGKLKKCQKSGKMEVFEKIKKN